MEDNILKCNGCNMGILEKFSGQFDYCGFYKPRCISCGNLLVKTRLDEIETIVLRYLKLNLKHNNAVEILQTMVFLGLTNLGAINKDCKFDYIRFIKPRIIFCSSNMQPIFAIP